MVFASVPFLFVFLPAVLAAYFLCPRRWHNAVLLVFSLFFYAWGEPVYILLMLSSITVSFLAGRALGHAWSSIGACMDTYAMLLWGALGLLGAVWMWRRQKRKRGARRRRASLKKRG